LSDPQTPERRENPIDPAVAAIITRKARSLVGRAGLQRQDCRDVEQELTLRLLENLDQFVARRGRRLAFVQRLVDRFASNLLRHRRAGQRDGGPHAPLPDTLPAPPGDDTRRLDLEQALASLPPDLRAVVESFLAGRSVTETAGVLGLSRATVYARLRELASRPEITAFLRDL
jgi:DNA-directed RNA polymerase specialized sigma24 family protein